MFNNIVENFKDLTLITCPESDDLLIQGFRVFKIVQFSNSLVDNYIKVFIYSVIKEKKQDLSTSYAGTTDLSSFKSVPLTFLSWHLAIIIYYYYWLPISPPMSVKNFW